MRERSTTLKWFVQRVVVPAISEARHVTVAHVVSVVTADSKLRVFSRNERAFSSASVFFKNSF